MSSRQDIAIGTAKSFMPASENAPMKRTAVVNIVGLSPSLLGPHSPRLNAFLEHNRRASICPPLPAVTCTSQANYITGRTATEHGIVGNGWYNRDLCEVQFWKQPEHLVQSPRLWDELRTANPQFTCAKVFWWYNMYSTADYTITPRPMYPADGRKVFDIYTWPYSIRTEIKKDLGEFPFPTFWGPAAGLDTPQGKPDEVSRWIARSAQWIESRYEPTLSLVYLPHLDYNLQRYGPGDDRIKDDVSRIDSIAGELIDFYRERDIRTVILSEYGISAVNTPVFLNRIFRQQNWVVVKDELGLELLDCGASKAFAVSDHQLAHVYINDPSLHPKVLDLLKQTPGVGRVLDDTGKKKEGLNHSRAGDLIAVADPNAWFSYYYWLDDRKAPDFARCVDIHRKPGYDPVELFINPDLSFVRLRIAWKLLKKKLGFRMLMDLIPLDATLVKGSHGARPDTKAEWPLLLTDPALLDKDSLDSTEVYQILRRSVLES